MKKGLIIFLVFAVVFVLALSVNGCFKTNSYTLTVNTTNTTIIVRDKLNNVVNLNNGQLEHGKTYTIEIVAHNDYELKVFKVNELSQINNLVNNKFSFVCTQNTTIYAVSVINRGEPDADTYSLMYQTAKYYPSNSKTVTDIVLRITSEDVGTICELRVGESYQYLVKGQHYTLDAYSLDNEYNRVAYTANNLLSIATFPRIFSANDNIVVNVKVCTIPIYSGPIMCIGSSGEEASEFVVGETYTLQDSAPAGYKSILYVNGQETPLPYTFTYTEDFDFDVEVVQRTGAFVTLPANFVPTFVLTQGTVTEYLSWSGNDGEMRFEDLSEYIGWDLSLRVKYPPYGYDQLSFRLNGGESTTEYHYGQITTDMFENFVLEPGIIPSPPTDVG